MLFRIVFSGYYIFKQYSTVDLRPLDGIKPKKLFAITLIVLGFLACKVSEVKFIEWKLYEIVLVIGS